MVVGVSLGWRECFPTPSPPDNWTYVSVADSNATHMAEWMPAIDRALRTKICGTNHPRPHFIQSAFSEDKDERTECLVLGKIRTEHWSLYILLYGLHAASVPRGYFEF